MPGPTVTIPGTVEEIPMPPSPDYDAVHALEDIVRLHEHVGSQKARKLIYRVVALPDPKARRKAEREAYGIEPIAGGPRTRAEAWMLVPASDADKAVAARTPRVTTDFVPGMVVTTSAGLKGADAGARLVILDITREGKAKVTLLGGMGGSSWSGLPLSTLTVNEDW